MMYQNNSNVPKMGARIVRGSEGFIDTVESVLHQIHGKPAIVTAKSMLSTEIMKILQPLVGTKYSPYDICNNIMNSICLEDLVGIRDETLLKSLLYNEFYKISLEITSYVDSTDVEKVIDRLSPTINMVIILINKSRG